MLFRTYQIILYIFDRSNDLVLSKNGPNESISGSRKKNHFFQLWSQDYEMWNFTRDGNCTMQLFSLTAASPHCHCHCPGVFRNNFILACEKKRKTGKKVLAKKKYKNLNHQNLRRSNFWQEKDWQQSLKPCYPKTKRRTSTEADLSFGPNLDIKHWIRGGQWVAVGEYYPNKQRNDSWRLIRTTTSALKGLL